MAELEACVGQNLWPLEQCGPPFRALRALRPLLFLDTGALPTSPLLRELPAAAAAHFLYQRAPAGLQSPLTRASLTPAQVRVVCALEVRVRIVVPMCWLAYMLACRGFAGTGDARPPSVQCINVSPVAVKCNSGHCSGQAEIARSSSSSTIGVRADYVSDESCAVFGMAGPAQP